MKILVLLLTFVSLGLSQAPNYFYTTLTNTITSTDTTCTISSGDTTYFGSRTNFYATIWDTYYSSPSHARSRGGKYETILIESRSGLTLQIARAKMSSTAQNFNTSGRTYRISVEPLNNIYDSLDIAQDSVSALRSAITALSLYDSVDVPIICGFTAQTWSAQTTLYAGFDGSWSTGSDSTLSKNSFGINGRVIAMYVQGKLNTFSAPSTITLQYSDSSSKTFTSGLTITLGVNQNFGSVTGQSLTVTPYKIGGFKFVNSSGSGSIQLGTITLVIRTKLN